MKGLNIYVQDIGPGMTRALTATDLTPSAAVKVASAISTLAHKGEGAAALSEQGAATTVGTCVSSSYNFFYFLS